MAGIADIFEARTALRLELEAAVAKYAEAMAEQPYLAASIASAMLHEHARHLQDECVRAV